MYTIEKYIETGFGFKVLKIRDECVVKEDVKIAFVLYC
jgi:hypothetical protein